MARYRHQRCAAGFQGSPVEAQIGSLNSLAQRKIDYLFVRHL